jgi:DNA-binding PadR family transcriptional regulator
MLSIEPMSGYDIKREVEKSISNFWSESYGQIYPVLRTLIAEKLVTKTVERDKGKPDRHVYALTARGRTELRRWLLKGFAPKIQRNEFLLKLFFGEEIPAKANIAHVEQYRQLQDGLLQKYRAVEQKIIREDGDNSNAPYWLMTVRYGEHVSRALLQWCDKTLAELKRMEGRERKTASR